MPPVVLTLFKLSKTEHRILKSEIKEKCGHFYDDNKVYFSFIIQLDHLQATRCVGTLREMCKLSQSNSY